ncbi:MAG: glycosyltransferase family 2 protein [Bacteroidota bacterium]
MKKISVIIVTYNSADLIIDCIDSILKYNDIGSENIEIIVVDNSSQVESRKIFQLLNQDYGSKVKFLNNETNLGYGHGNNIGIKASSGNLICVMNPDIRLIEPLFSDVIKQFEKREKLGMIGYRQRGGRNISFYIKPEFFIPLLNSVLIRVANKLNLFLPKYFFLSGAFLFIDKTKFKEIGMFDKNIFLYSEEADISQRFQMEGYLIKFSGKHKYLHLVGNRTVFKENIINNKLISSKYYFKKYNRNWKNYVLKKKIEIIFKIIFYRLINNKNALSKYLKIKNLFYKKAMSHFFF